jgi:hypothetical protein
MMLPHVGVFFRHVVTSATKADTVHVDKVHIDYFSQGKRSPRKAVEVEGRGGSCARSSRRVGKVRGESGTMFRLLVNVTFLIENAVLTGTR